MPIYEYRCEVCGHEMEAIQKFRDRALKDCPACGKPELKKLVSAAGFQLKGTGWYVTDFKDSDKKKAKAGSDSGAKTGTESDTKPKKEEKKASSSNSSD
ncbi:MAG: FmdB family zinc ribbon protein [Acidiferrobacterales bacterium]